MIASSNIHHASVAPEWNTQGKRQLFFQLSKSPNGSFYRWLCLRKIIKFPPSTLSHYIYSFSFLKTSCSHNVRKAFKDLWYFQTYSLRVITSAMVLFLAICSRNVLKCTVAQRVGHKTEWQNELEIKRRCDFEVGGWSKRNRQTD